MLPPPEGVWGLTPEQLADLPGYGPDVEKSREEGARASCANSATGRTSR